MSTTKFLSSCVPSVEWYTSGWNWMPHVCSPPDVEGGDAHVLGAGDQFIVVGHARNGVAVRHPHLRAGRKAAHQRIRGVAHGEHRTAVFAAGRGLHLAAESRGEELRAVADAQQRQFALDGRKVGSRGLCVPHGEGTARKNHAPHRRVYRRNFVEGVDFAIDVQFADTACDQLRVLRSEVENQDFFHISRSITFQNFDSPPTRAGEDNPTPPQGPAYAAPEGG